MSRTASKKNKAARVKLPSVDRILSQARTKKLISRYGRAGVKEAVRDELARGGKTVLDAYAAAARRK